MVLFAYVCRSQSGITIRLRLFNNQLKTPGRSFEPTNIWPGVFPTAPFLTPCFSVYTIHAAIGIHHTWTQNLVSLLCRWHADTVYVPLKTSKDEDFHQLCSCLSDRKTFWAEVCIILIKTFWLPVHKCQSYSEEPICNICQWPIIWETS